MGRKLVNLDNVYANNLGMLRKICEVENPSVIYQSSFFDELFPKDTKKDTFFAQLAYYSEMPVGAIKSKLYPKKKGDNYPKGIHIEVMAVLDQYKDNAIEDEFLAYVSEQCKNHHQHNIYVHVPVTDESSISWYKEHGFEADEQPLKDIFTTKGGSVDGILLKKHIE